MTRTKKGFTLVELSIATAFLSVLLVLLALITLEIVSIYRKGLAIKSINATGKELIEGFTAAITAAPAKDLTASCSDFFPATSSQPNSGYSKCLNDEAYKLVYHQHYYTVNIDGVDSIVPTNGSFCTGLYSYVWNTGYFYGDKYQTAATPATLTYVYKDTKKTIDFRLLRVLDPSRLVCASQINNEYEFTGTYTAHANYDISSYNSTQYALAAEPTELLASKIDTLSQLALFDFKAYPPAQDHISKQIFYPATFVLATTQGGVNVTATGDYCLAPTGIDTDFYYCAINKFNFAARAVGGQHHDESNI